MAGSYIPSIDVTEALVGARHAGDPCLMLRIW